MEKRLKWKEIQEEEVLNECWQKKGKMADIIYTTVDEAPELASASLLPIIKRFAAAAGLQVEKRDISLAGRIIAIFPDFLTQESILMAK